MIELLKSRLVRVVFFGDSYPTRVSLSIAEFLLVLQVLFNIKTPDSLIRTLCGPCRWVWFIVLLVAFVGNVFFLVIHRRSYKAGSSIFALYDATVWIMMNVVVVLTTSTVNATLAALGLASCWVFIISGYCTHGKRSTDYGWRK